jgi:hypothetical protein
LNAPAVGFSQVFIPSVDLPFAVLLSSTWLTTEVARLHSCPSPRVQSLALASAARRSPLRARRSARVGSYGRLFHGILRPFDALRIHAATDALASRRVCLTRLGGTFRFSQPLGALLRAYPLRPCFMPVTPLGLLDLQRFPLQGARSASRTALRCLPKVTPCTPFFTVCPCPPCRYGSCDAPRLMRSAPLDFEDFSSPGVRSPRTGFTRDPRVDSSLDLLPLRGLFLERPRLVCLHTSLLSWASPRCPAVACPSP